MSRALTLAWVRWRIWCHGLRSGTGVVNAAAAVALAVIGILVSLGLATLFAALTHAAADGGEEALRTVYLIVFYSLAFFALVMPLFVRQAKTGLDLARLAIFPMSRRGFYGIALAASLASGPNLFWYPSLVAVALFGVLTQEGGPLLGLCLLAALALAFVVWGNTLLMLLAVVTRRRGVKELLGVVGLMVLMLASVGPALLESVTGREALEVSMEKATLPPVVAAAASVLPPSLAAAGLSSLSSGSAVDPLANLIGLGLWAAAGAGLGYMVLSRYLLEGEGPRPARRAAKTEAGARSGFDLARLLPAEVAAVASKELRYILRSAAGKFSLAVMPLLAVLAGLMFVREQPVLGIDPGQVTLFGLMLYASLMPANMLINAFAWEGSGAQSYFLGPAPLERVVLGKNLGVWLFSAILLAECLVTWCLLVGLPDVTTLVTATLLLASSIANLTMAGNFTSVLFPVKRSPSAVANSPSQVALLISFGSLLLSALLLVCLLLAAVWVGAPWAQPLFVAALLGLQALAYRLLLRPAARLLAARRERLTQTLLAST